jgi:hypothetical protein
LEVETEALRGELQTKEATRKATTPPAVAYEKFVTELAEHMPEPEYRERVKVALRNIIDTIQFIDKKTFTVNFRGGKAIEVWMSDGAFKWELAKQVGAVQVP